MEAGKLVSVLIAKDDVLKMRTTESPVVTTSFCDLGLKEEDLEVFLDGNMHLLLNEDGTTPSLQVIGRQVRNEFGGKCDLLAIDSEGSIVVIEIKRDLKDCKNRAEAFEIQAIRYASSFTKIRTPQELAEKIYAPYLFNNSSLEQRNLQNYAKEKIESFLTNKISNFNKKQKIILIASGFFPETISACAWLRKNGIDIKCIRISPLIHDSKNFLLIEQILPPPELDDLLGDVGEAKVSRNSPAPGSTVQPIGRAKFMTTAEMIENNLLKKDDVVYVKGHPESIATIQDHRTVKYNGKVISWNEWAKNILEWSAVNIYSNVLKDGKTLDEIRTSAQGLLDQQNDNIDSVEEQCSETLCASREIQ